MSKDYSYRSTWEHAYSRAYNLAHRGGLTKEKMMEKYGRFPTKKEWFSDISEEEWKIQYLKKFPKPDK